MPRLRISQTQWVLVAMIVGVAVGVAFPDRPGTTGFHATDLQILSTLFLRMIESLIAPLLFGTLVVGISGHGDDMRRVGKLAVRSLLYFEVVTTLALIVGLVVVNIVKPGIGVSLATATIDTGTELAKTKVSLATVLEHAVPRSVVEAGARNESLQIVFFSIVFAVGLAQVAGPGRAVMLSFCESLCDAMFKYVGIVMKFAPLGVGGAIAATVGRSGVDALMDMARTSLNVLGNCLASALMAQWDGSFAPRHDDASVADVPRPRPTRAPLPEILQ
jgi:proton glutamate symport protein